MDILFCIDTMSKGGAERVIANMSNAFAREHNINILTLSKRKIEYNLDDRIAISSVYNKEKKKNFFEKIIFLWKTANLYKKKIKEIKPEVIVSFLPYSSYFSIIAARKLNIPIIVSIRNDPKEEYKSKVNYILMKLLYKKANGFIFQTEDAKKFFAEGIQKKSTIIPNPINPEFITAPYEGNREKTIVTVGRLETQKNHVMLLEAFKKFITKCNDDYKLVIYGEGSLKQSLIEKAKELKISEKVEFAGQVQNVKEKIYKSSIFVLSSNFEGMPNSLMEAMALGIPSIATDCPCGGCKFLIEDGVNGFLVPIGNSEILSQKMQMIVENVELQNKFSKEANKITENLKPEKINSRWEKYIKDIMNESVIKNGKTK